MLGLNHDFPLLLPTILEDGAANFGSTAIISYGPDEVIRSDYAHTAERAPRLASSIAPRT